MAENKNSSVDLSKLLQNATSIPLSLKTLVVKYSAYIFLSIVVLAFAILLMINFSRLPRPEKDIVKQYINTIRSLGMTPVYPPREEVRVGDVYYSALDEKNEVSARVWIGRLTSVVDHAEAYIGTFRYSHDENVDYFSRLPIIVFPDITGETSGVGELGGALPQIWSRSKIETSKDVTVRFPDVRVYGIPTGAVTLGNLYENEFKMLFCEREGQSKDTLMAMLQDTSACFKEIAEDLDDYSCRIELVTRVFLTKEISFDYGTSSSNYTAISNGEMDNLHENATDGAKSNAANTTDAVESENPNAVPPSSSVTNVRGNNTERSIIFATTSGSVVSSLEIDKQFARPVSIGYEALLPSNLGWHLCSNP